MKRITSLLVFLMLFSLWSIAQEIQITGKVTNADDGSLLPGVSVMVKGTSQGATTNVNGEFSLKTYADATLVFTFVGMKTIEVPVAGQTVMDIKMEMEATGLEEVVVTALGVAREKKSLGYSVQEVKGDDINQVKNDNIINSLSGKIAGVQVRNNTNIGGSSNIVIRGSSSLTQSNQALFIIDGVPVDNSNTNNSGQTTGRSGYDYGNAASDINPNDIESINILKGAAATALYGSRAANGVVLIITKKGGKPSSGKNIGVSLNSNVTIGVFDKSTFPKYQQEYGAGYGEYYGPNGDSYWDEDDVNGDGVTDYLPPYYEDASRGAAFDPSLMVYHWDAFIPESPNFMKATPWTAAKNGPETFFETAVSYTNTIDVTGGSEKTNYRVSYTNLDQKGILPNSSLKRNNFAFNGSHKVTDKLKLSSSANYVHTAGKGRNSTGYSDNIMSSFRQWYQVNADIKTMKDLYDLTGRNATWNPKSWNNSQPSYWDNPYWVRYQNYETDERNRLIGFVQADYQITGDLSIMGRASVDTYNELQEERKAVGSVAGELGVDRPDVTSGYSRLERTYIESNYDVMLNFHKKLGVADIAAIAGTNVRRSKVDQVFASTNNGLANAGIYSLQNSVDPMLPPEEILDEKGVNGVFGNVSVGFSNMVFFEGSLRRDQSSTLPKKNNAYFYPSVSGSFLFSSLVNQSWLSLGKLRVNYAEVGNDAPPRRITDTYSINASFNGSAMSEVPDTKNNPNLKPERSKSMEAGLEMNFLQSRVGFDLALYKVNTVDQLMPLSVSWATGRIQKWVNAGEIENKGIELALKGTPVKTSDFNWDVTVNWAKNINKVISLYVDEAGNEVTNLSLDGGGLQGGVTINARVGEAYGTIQGSDYVYHDNGQPIVKANGRYLISSSNDIVIGNFNPDWNAGINNAFTYKNFALSFLVDWQHGGDIFSLDMWYGISTGLYPETVGNNDLGNPKRNPRTYVNDDPAQGYAPNSGGILNPGVFEDGTPNNIRVNGANYAADGYAVSPNSRYIYDASYVKLRELVFTYNLPHSLFAKTFIYGASVSFVGSNLWIIHKNLPYADPEASQGSGNIQGWQSGVMPATKNYGFSLKLQF